MHPPERLSLRKLGSDSPDKIYPCQVIRTESGDKIKTRERETGRCLPLGTPYEQGVHQAAAALVHVLGGEAMATAVRCGVSTERLTLQRLPPPVPVGFGGWGRVRAVNLAGLDTRKNEWKRVRVACGVCQAEMTAERDEGPERGAAGRGLVVVPWGEGKRGWRDGRSPVLPHRLLHPERTTAELAPVHSVRINRRSRRPVLAAGQAPPARRRVPGRNTAPCDMLVSYYFP